MKIRSIGQSGFIITLPSGAVIITDPWLSLSPIKRFRNPIEPGNVPRCDVLAVSHPHIDHFDPFTIRKLLKHDPHFVGPPSSAAAARLLGCPNTMKMKSGHSEEFGRLGVRITGVPAFHPLARDAVGFVIEADKTVYYSGDTRYDARIIERLGRFKIDIALLQIACAVYFGKKDGMDIEDAAKLAVEIRPRAVIPMHYHDIFRHPDPELFRRRLAGDGIRVDILKPGEEKEY